MKKGDRVNLKDGRQGIIVRFGTPDFANDPTPVYVQIQPRAGESVTIETVVLMSDELMRKPRQQEMERK